MDHKDRAAWKVQVVAMFDEGMAPQDIAEIVERQPDHVRQVLRDNGRNPRAAYAKRATVFTPKERAERRRRANREYHRKIREGLAASDPDKQIDPVTGRLVLTSEARAKRRKSSRRKSSLRRSGY